MIFSMGRGIPNVKHHVESDGGKELYNTDAGVWFKELNQSQGSDLDLILNRNIFSLTKLRLRNSVSDGKHHKGACDWLLLPAHFLHVTSTLRPPHYLQLTTTETDCSLFF